MAMRFQCLVFVQLLLLTLPHARSELATRRATATSKSPLSLHSSTTSPTSSGRSCGAPREKGSCSSAKEGREAKVMVKHAAKAAKAAKGRRRRSTR